MGFTHCSNLYFCSRGRLQDQKESTWQLNLGWFLPEVVDDGWICTLPRGGMYWVVHLWPPRDFLRSKRFQPPKTSLLLAVYILFNVCGLQWNGSQGVVAVQTDFSWFSQFDSLHLKSNSLRGRKLKKRPSFCVYRLSLIDVWPRACST